MTAEDDASFTIEVVHEEVDGQPVAELRLHGELDTFASARFDETLEEIVTAGAKSIVIDIEAVSFIDSSGLRSLVRARQRFPAADAFALRNPQPVAVRLLEITGLHDHFPIR